MFSELPSLKIFIWIYEEEQEISFLKIAIERITFEKWRWEKNAFVGLASSFFFTFNYSTSFLRLY